MLGQFVPQGWPKVRNHFFHRIVLFLFLRDAGLFITSVIYGHVFGHFDKIYRSWLPLVRLENE